MSCASPGGAVETTISTSSSEGLASRRGTRTMVAGRATDGRYAPCMFGFVGFVTSDRRNLPEGPVGAALAVLAPRGPDGAGRARVPVGARSLELGVRRLALVDPERGRQPLTRPSGAVLAFNGEVY